MMPLWIINVVVWLLLLIYVTPSAWAATRIHARHGDPMRLAVFATALMMMGFSLRWLLAPDSILLWQLLYILAAADAVFIGILCRVYGRGPRA